MPGQTPLFVQVKQQVEAGIPDAQYWLMLSELLCHQCSTAANLCQIMEDSTGDAFILNRYFMRQMQQQQNKRCSSKKSTSTPHTVFDVNANEYFSNEQLDDSTSGQNRCFNGDCHKARIYYDLPLYLNSSFSTVAAKSSPKVDSVAFIRKTDIDSPSRSSHAKLPNCLRRKQQVIKSKHVESYLESKSANSANIESFIDHELFRHDIIDPNSCFNDCWIGQKDIVPIVETAGNSKRIFDRRKRSHIRHIVKTTREKINQSLSTFRRSAKSRKPRFSQEHRNGGTFFTNSYSDPDLHLSVQRLIEQKSCQNCEHLVMQCRETQFVLSHFSSVDNFFDEAYNETHVFENELNHVKKKSILRTNFLRRNEPISSERGDLIKRYNQLNRVATKKSSSSNETVTDDSDDSDSEGEFTLSQSTLSHSNGHEKDMLEQPQFAGTCTPFDVPNWQELCERIYRFRLQMPAQPLSWMESHQMIAHKESQPSIPEQRLDRDSQAPSLESTQSCRQELFSPSINIPTTSQPKACPQLESLLHETSDPVEPKNKFDVEKFIRCVAKRIFAIARESHENDSLEATIVQLDLTQLDDVFRHVNNLTAVRAYKTFLVDLCKEITISNFCTKSSCDTKHFSLMLPLRSQKQPWPSTVDRFVQQLLGQMKSLSVFESMEKSPMSAKNAICNDRRKCAQDVKRFGLMAYCRMQRKLDLVDSVLYREMLDDEHRWSFQGPEMLQIKRQLLMGS